jgi:hypothetical protein
MSVSSRARQRRVILIPGGPPPNESLESTGNLVLILEGQPPSEPLCHRASTGEHLARILEDHLCLVLAFGENIYLRTTPKRRRDKHLGGRRFVDPA